MLILLLYKRLVLSSFEPPELGVLAHHSFGLIQMVARSRPNALDDLLEVGDRCVDAADLLQRHFMVLERVLEDLLHARRHILYSLVDLVEVRVVVDVVVLEVGLQLVAHDL